MKLELLRKSMEDAPTIQRGKYRYFIHPLTDSIPPITAQLMREVCEAITEIADLDADYILTMEAMGIHISAVLSQMTGVPVNIIRKRKYGVEGEIEIAQETGYSQTKMYLNNVRKGDVVTIVDAVISTGGTLTATLSALTEKGAIVKDIICVIERGEGVENVRKKTGYDIKTLVKIAVDERVQILKIIN
ncbi:MAG: purine phosphoribosyltransferase family protein [Candidatus Altiarchaeota archaeon]|nr:purine phosphoribosyltransferase family protein [Candidatus Altiarchaeota archaeon]